MAGFLVWFQNGRPRLLFGWVNPGRPSRRHQPTVYIVGVGKEKQGKKYLCDTSLESESRRIMSFALEMAGYCGEMSYVENLFHEGHPKVCPLPCSI